MRLFPIVDIQLVDISSDVLVNYTHLLSTFPILGEIGKPVVIKKTKTIPNCGHFS